MSDNNDETTPEPENTAPETQDQENYQVGYKKPPKHSQFKKGEPSPRKGKKLNGYYYDEIFWEIARETVKVNIGGRVRRMPRIEACIRLLAQLAINGDRRALIHYLETFAADSALIQSQASGEWFRRHGEAYWGMLAEEDELI